MHAVRRGASQQRDAGTAARELSEQLCAPETAAALFFCSAEYDLGELEAQLAARFAGIDLIGCTTAGEIAPGGYADRGIVGLGFDRAAFTAVAARSDGLSSESLVRVCEMVSALVRKLHIRAPGANAKNTFAILLIDGLSGFEEPVLSAIYRELGDIPLVGGSAGDNLRFRETMIFHDGAFHSGSAVLALVHTCVPFSVFKTQHIASLETKMVVTEADPVRRTVTEINAEPASDEYARLSGVSGRELRPMLLATHPLVVRVGGDDYVRSIQKVNVDRSLTFYCAIDEGIVLSAASGHDIVDDLARLFTRLREEIGAPTAILGFDCIFRRLELIERRLEHPVSRMLAANNVIGFSTYGEQINAMHLNQTFSGVAFGEMPARS